MHIDKQHINAQLQLLAQKHKIQILHACESGSRAWGFASADSDYDIRFIYAHPLPWYLRVQAQRDVIDPAIDGLLDIGGWDLRKALRLMIKGNAPLNEWLNSPIVYQQQSNAVRLLQEVQTQAFLPRGACHHYLSLGEKRCTALFAAQKTRLKDYFYALRALLCARFIIDHKQAPPLPLRELLHAYLKDAALLAQIHTLLAHKSQSREGDTTARIGALDTFLRQQITECKDRIPPTQDALENARFDQVFLEILSLNETPLSAISGPPST